MRLLDDLPPFLFFTGKGGVGKTTLSCAAAVRLAREGRRVLLVSTDPASNIGHVFGQDVGSAAAPIDTVEGLRALEIDPQAAANGYRERVVGPVRDTLPAEVVASIEEQLSGACTTEIAAFDEFTALLTDATVTGSYDHVIFDTAPTGHTIRLLQLPGAWTGFIETNPDGASCLGPLAGLDKQRQKYADAVAALADPRRTRMVLVARAQAGSLTEAARTHAELAATGLSEQHLVVNGVLPAAGSADDPLAASLHHREQAALAAMPEVLQTLPLDEIELKGFSLVGVEALSALLDGSEIDPGSPVEELEHRDGLPGPGALIDQIADAGHGLVMTMGKGGVGKTTMAAAIAVALAERGLPVHLTTSDPAAHLTETLAGSLPQLEVSRIDPQAETLAYSRHVLETKGKGLDGEGSAMLEEDLRSPCTEEIAVFQAFSRRIREAARKVVVMDTAPTGHTLMLLDATGSYHRDVTRHSVPGLRVTTPMMQLQDPDRTKVILVTLPETTPVLEAARLQEDLLRAGIRPWAWIINNSLAAADASAPLLRRRAARELSEIAAVRDHYAHRIALVPVQEEEPVGIDRLLALADGRPSRHEAASVH
jgi:arsenite/tail-anchored protein-transporting ATPase